MTGNQLSIINKGGGKPPVPKWTRDAYHCFKVVQDCRQCPLHQAYGIKREDCFIPVSVAWLLAEGIPIPALFITQDEKGPSKANQHRPAVKEGRIKR